MVEIKQAKEKMKELMDKLTDKESIDAISAINEDLDKAEEKHKKLQEDNNELLADYRKLSKAASFSGEKEDPSGKKEFSFESFAEEYFKKEKEK